jgi:threonine dehydrogenase-like Zn-dependent dehydrogenase
MRAMTYRGPYRVRVVDKPMPGILHPRDAIVRVTRACICGSDLHLYHGLVPDTRIGHTFGHEFVGVVEEVGPDVRNLKAGDRVCVPFNIFCGECYFCRKGLFGNCHNVNPNATAAGGIYGYSHTTGGYDGGQAEYVRVPFADAGPTKIPEGIDDDDAALCTDAYPTGYFGAEMAGIRRGDSVVVFGAGPVGLFAARSAWFMGAGRVMVVDQEDYRLEFARWFAQCETLNFRDVRDPVWWLKRESDWLGWDAAIDAVGCEAAGGALQRAMGIRPMKLLGGSAKALHWAIDSVRKGGVVSVIGVYGPTYNAVPIGDAMNKGLTLRMNQTPVKRYHQRCFDHILAGHIRPSDVITHRIPLEDIADGYHLFASKLDGCIKPMVIPPRAVH